MVYYMVYYISYGLLWFIVCNIRSIGVHINSSDEKSVLPIAIPAKGRGGFFVAEAPDFTVNPMGESYGSWCTYPLVVTNSSPWKDPPILKNGKPSISMGHLCHFPWLC